jgi:hypothetical protein
MEMIVAIRNTHLRLFESDFQMFAGRTRKAQRSITQNILTENAMKSER